MIAAGPASGGAEGEPVPLPARGTGVISGSDLEAREDKHEAFGDGRHAVSRWGPEDWAQEAVSGQQKCTRHVCGDREDSRLPTSTQTLPSS